MKAVMFERAITCKLGDRLEITETEAIMRRADGSTDYVAIVTPPPTMGELAARMAEYDASVADLHRGEGVRGTRQHRRAAEQALKPHRWRDGQAGTAPAVSRQSDMLLEGTRITEVIDYGVLDPVTKPTIGRSYMDEIARQRQAYFCAVGKQPNILYIGSDVWCCLKLNPDFRRRMVEMPGEPATFDSMAIVMVACLPFLEHIGVGYRW